MEKPQQEEIKNMYDKRIYELDLSKSILQKIKGYDYRFPKKYGVDHENESTDGSSTSSRLS